jgi:hypothetical protein
MEAAAEAAAVDIKHSQVNPFLVAQDTQSLLVEVDQADQEAEVAQDLKDLLQV